MTEGEVIFQSLCELNYKTPFSLYNSRQTGHKDLHELNKDTGDTAK